MNNDALHFNHLIYASMLEKQENYCADQPLMIL